MPPQDVHIAAVIMCKNEHKRMIVTLNSVKGYANSVVLYDTGSEDDTIDIVRNFCLENSIPFRLKTGTFVDFSTSRNVMLDFADTFPDIDYYLLLDVNDELRGGVRLREIAKQFKDKENTGFLLRQEWWSGIYQKYYNIRFIKARESWKYHDRVHEWIQNSKYPGDVGAPPQHKVDDPEISLYQDRTLDDDKTGKRFAKDKVLLLADHKDQPENTRTLFYLAQTCGCLNQKDEAFYYYKLRSTLDGFWEEKYKAFFHCGELARDLDHPWKEVMGWYIQSFEVMPRAEPMLKIAEHYRDKNWTLAYMFADMACKVTYPTYATLWVDEIAYEYTRWHTLGIIAYYAGFYAEGKKACQEALKSKYKHAVDENNLKLYEKKELEITKNTEQRMTKNQFIENKCNQLQSENPRLTRKQVENKASLLWKLREKKGEEKPQELPQENKEYIASLTGIVSTPAPVTEKKVSKKKGKKK